jgi:formylglycine-generating enzyme required for sulfatase activity
MVAPTAWFPDRVDLIVPLVAEADVLRGMVRIQGGTDPGIVEPRSVGDFWIDRHEVTNREFKRFVDAGGYEKREYWKHPFVRDGRELSWAQALEGFRDTTAGPDRRAGSWGTIQREKRIFRSPASAGTKRQRMPSSSGRRCRRFIIGGTLPDSASASRSSRSATSAVGNRIQSEPIAPSARTAPSTWRETRRNGAGTRPCAESATSGGAYGEQVFRVSPASFRP